jgi:hypothetical protein
MIAAIYALIIALILSPAFPAWAECAWVLWGMTPSPSGPMFHPPDAFKTREECHAEKTPREEKMKVDIKEGRATTATVILFSCLPDTIDPRGPKGGGR